jgi:hypothetical protein
MSLQNKCGGCLELLLRESPSHFQREIFYAGDIAGVFPNPHSLYPAVTKRDVVIARDLGH